MDGVKMGFNLWDKYGNSIGSIVVVWEAYTELCRRITSMVFKLDLPGVLERNNYSEGGGTLSKVMIDIVWVVQYNFDAGDSGTPAGGWNI